MIATKTTVRATVLLVAFWGPTITWAQDWPQWRGPHRDAKVQGFEAPAAWPETLTQAWSISVGAGDASPCLVGDRLYLFVRQNNQEVVLCLNAADGQEIWRYAADAPEVGGPARSHAGPRSTLVALPDAVLAMGVSGALTCLNPDGSKRWTQDPFPGQTPRFFTASSPLVADGLAIAFQGGPGQGGLMAYDLRTGAERWRWTAEGPDYASVALMEVGGRRQVVALTEKSVVGVQLSDGALLWQHPFAPVRRSYNSVTPVIDADTVIITAAGRGTTALRIEPTDDGFTARQLWTTSEAETVFNTPVLKDGYLYGVNPNGRLFCLNARNGTLAWMDDTRRGTRGFASLIDAGPCLMALPNDGRLVVFAANPEAYTEIKTYAVSQQETYTYPVLAGRRLWVKDIDHLTLWTLP